MKPELIINLALMVAIIALIELLKEIILAR